MNPHSPRAESFHFFVSVSLFLTDLQLASGKDGNISLQQPLKPHRNEWLTLESNTRVFSKEQRDILQKKFCSSWCTGWEGMAKAGRCPSSGLARAKWAAGVPVISRQSTSAGGTRLETLRILRDYSQATPQKSSRKFSWGSLSGGKKKLKMFTLRSARINWAWVGKIVVWR